MGDARRNRTSQTRLKARLGMKSFNLNLKVECKQCDLAKGRKRARMEKEDADAENNEVTEESDITEDENEEDVEESISEGSRKRKKTGENHTHCHCPLFPISDELTEFMTSGQPWQRFEKENLKRREAAKVERVLLLQRRKEVEKTYKFDMKKELERFKNALKLSRKEKEKQKTQPKTQEQKRSRREEIEEKRRQVKENLPLLFQ